VIRHKNGATSTSARQPDAAADARRGFPPVSDSASACAFLGISEPVLREAMRCRGLPYRRIGAKVLRFSSEALAAWVKGATGAAGDDHSGDLDGVG